MRVAAIAIDGTEWSVLDRLMTEGHLPNLRAIRDRSLEVELDQQVAYRSEQPWTRFLSGRSPEEMQWWTLESFDPATYGVWSQGAYRGDPFYAGTDRSCIVFDVPHASLSRGVRGQQVTGWGAHGAQYPRASWPAGLLTDVDDRVGPHPAFDRDYDNGWYEPRYINALATALTEGARSRPDALAVLTERQADWDLLLTSFSETHSAGHHLWHGLDAGHPLHDAPTGTLARRRFTEVAAAVDEGIGRMVASLPPDTVVLVFAHHGMMAADDVPSMLLVPELLHRRQFGRPLLRGPHPEQWVADGCPPVAPDSPHAWGGSAWIRREWASTARGRARNVVVRRLSPPLDRAARRLTGRPVPALLGDLDEPIPPEAGVPPEQIDPAEPIDWQPAAWYRPWWPRMRWFAVPTFADTHIRVNLRGRERDGLVDPEDYGAALDEAETVLRGIRDPRTGDEVIAELIRLREDDPFAEPGPDADLLVVWNRGLDAIVHPDVGLVGPAPFMRTGAHSANGFALVSGLGIERQVLDRRRGDDLGATVAALLGMPERHRTGGRAVEEIVQATRGATSGAGT